MPMIGAQSCMVFDHGGRIAPASKVQATFSHPAVDGLGVITGPKRQAGGMLAATTYHKVADRPAALVLMQALAAMVDASLPITIDPVGDGTGGTAIANVVVLGVELRRMPVRGLPDSVTSALSATSPNRELVVADWRLLLPVTYLAP